ncbi:MAG TPA: cytochrome c1 [Dongiaceae bacterium]|jgi:ubiquinol-cytochrome c reductase cytochrome c1 subunit
MSARRIILAVVTIVAGIAALLIVLASPVPHSTVKTQEWGFNGFFGSFDQAQLKRGFQVYKDVCSACHSMNLLHYRDLEKIGFSEDEVKSIAAEVQVQDGPNDAGDMFDRPGKPSDPFKAPFANEQQARASNNGALPPDFSLIAKSRAGAGFTGYEGADYIYSLMTSYQDPPPAGFKLGANMHYNEAFKGHQIAMPPPLSDDAVSYADGTKASLDQEAKDVANFLTWASETDLEERHRTGIKAILFLVIFTLLAYATKRRVWADVH